MEVITLIEKCHGKLQNENVSIPTSFHQIVTDTRILSKNDIFVALKGQNTDGNLYIKEAIKKGAALIFTEDEFTDPIVPIIQVKDAYQCLRDLGSCYLEEYQPFVIAVTGSVGKTTTKELIAHMMKKKYHVLKSEGNKNNRIGIPQTLFCLDETIDCLVVELGMNHLHEIDILSDLVKPDIAVITNIGSAHIGNLGSKKNILKAKMEITSGMDGGILLLNARDQMLKKIKSISRGMVRQIGHTNQEIEIKLLKQTMIGSHIMMTDGVSKEEILFPNPGLFLLDDIALAVAVAQELKLSFSDIVAGLKEYQPMSQRFMVETLKNNNLLINDSYNSSYESLMMDLELLKNIEKHKVLILGDILELGKKSKKIHKKIGKQLKKLNDTELYFIGTEMKEAYKKCQKGHYTESVSMMEMNDFDIPENCIILLKGSRRMHLEELVPLLKQ